MQNLDDETDKKAPADGESTKSLESFSPETENSPTYSDSTDSDSTDSELNATSEAESATADEVNSSETEDTKDSSDKKETAELKPENSPIAAPAETVAENIHETSKSEAAVEDKVRPKAPGSTLSKKWLAEKWLQENQSDSGTKIKPNTTSGKGSRATTPAGKFSATTDQQIAMTNSESTLQSAEGAALDDTEYSAAAELMAEIAAHANRFEKSYEEPKDEIAADSSIHTPSTGPENQPVDSLSSTNLARVSNTEQSIKAQPHRQSDSSTALSKLSASTSTGMKAIPDPERSAEQSAQNRELAALERKKLKDSSFAATGVSTENPDLTIAPKLEDKEVLVKRALQASGAWVSVVLLVSMGAFAYQQFQSNRSMKHLGNVEFALKNGMQKQALQELNDAIAADPGHHPEAYINRGSIYVSLKRPQDAASDFRAALQMDPTNVKGLCGQAQAMIALGKNDQAEGILKKAIKQAPKDPQPYRVRAQLYLDNHAGAKAYADLLKVIQLAGNNSTAEDFEALAKESFDRGHLADAAHNYESALKLSPNKQLDVIRLGESYSKLGDTTKALSAFKRATLLDPTTASAYFETGKCYQTMKEYDKALDSFNSALSRNSNNKEALLDRAQCFLSLKQYNHAVDDFDSYLKLDPKSPTVKKQREIAYARVKATPKATAEKPSSVEPQQPALPSAQLKQLTERVKTDQPGVVQIGNGYLASGDYDSAVSVLVLCVKANPSDPNARRSLSLALFNSGRYGSAASQYRDLSRLATLTDEEQRNYVKALTQAGQVNDAVHMIMRMLAAKPDDDDLQILLVQTYADAGMADKAQMAARSALTKVKTQVAKEKINSIVASGGSSPTVAPANTPDNNGGTPANLSTPEGRNAAKNKVHASS